MAIDIKDIAKRAGTSAASVSFVLNNKWRKKVKPEIARRIKQIAERYNYMRNSTARGLAMKRRFRIALCIQGLLTEHPIMGTFSFHELLSTVTARLNKKGYALDIMQIESPFLSHLKEAENTIGQNDDAVLFLGWKEHSISDFLHRLNLSLPYVAVDANLKDKGLSYSYTDMAESTRNALSCFIGRGHRRIAFVRGETSRERFIAKLKAYREVLRESDIEFAPELIYKDAKLPIFARGYLGGEYLLSLKEMPTAIFCSDNMCALGLISYLKERGVTIPRDVEIIGFGDRAIANLCDPPLSYVKRPIKEMD